MIRHLRVHLRLQIFAAVCNRCIGGIQLNVLDALGDTAKRQSRLNIRENLAIDLFVVHQSGKAKIQQVFIAKLRRDVHKSLHGYDVHRVLDTETKRGKPAIGFSVPVSDRSAVRIRIRCIVLRGRQSQTTGVQSRCIRRYHLKGRSGLTHRIRRTVQCPVCLLLTSAAGNCKDISRVLILQRQRNLRLCRNIISFAKDRISGADDSILVLFLTGLRVFLRIENQGKIRIGLTEVAFHHLCTVVGNRPIRALHGQLILQVPSRSIRIVSLIIDNLIHDALNFRILRGINIQTAAVQQRVSLRLRISLLHQICEDLIGQRIHEIRVDRIVVGIVVHNLNARINIILQGIVVLILRNPSLVPHILKDLRTALLIMLRINNRIIIRRILRNSRNDRAFRQIQLADRLAKIPSRCRFYAKCAVS